MDEAGANGRPRVFRRKRKSQLNFAWTVAYGPNFADFFFLLSSFPEKTISRADLGLDAV